MSLEKKSRILSYLLRHSKEPLYIDLNGGWADVEVVLKQLRITREELDLIVSEDAKGRYAYNEAGDKIRAVQGHSIEGVEIEMGKPYPPKYLYHGTARRFLDDIKRDGLKPMTRQFVHISPDYDTAVKVGSRHGDPAVLIISAQEFVDAGNDLYLSENGVWQAHAVPSEFFHIDYMISLEEGQSLYERARKITLRQARYLIENAREDDERDFWQFVYNMNKKRNRNEAAYDIYCNSGAPVGWWDVLEPFVNEILDFWPIWDLYIGVHMGDHLVFGPYFTQKATQQERHDYYKKVEMLQYLANEAVSKVCKKCGQPGVCRDEEQKIGMVYCDACYQERCQDTTPGDPAIYGPAEKRWCDARGLPILRYYHRESPGRMNYGTHGEISMITTEEPVICYHCETPIEAGSRAALLMVTDDNPEEGEKGDRFILHENCAAWRCYREDVTRENRD